ncbi:hypothetical protein L1887_39356 [Cichorium endivia]|nr:hypothetical protein L1887_39356 [Cichorium endivia]
MDGIKWSRAEAHLPELSSDIVFFHILPRLPAKSVLRFRSVSKHWRSFLTTSVFAQMHLPHVTDDDLKLIVLSRTPYPLPFTFRTIDCERPKDGLTANRPLPFNVGPVRSIVILTSFHGLVCVGIVSERKNYPRRTGYYADLVLWNPLTADYKMLSKPSSDYEEECYATAINRFRLYYSSGEADYKLIRVTYHPNVYIYSLKSDSWRKIETRKEDFHRIPYLFTDNRRWQPSVMLNDNIYFLERIPRRPLCCDYKISIMKYDTKTENLKKRAAPSFGNRRTSCLSFTVLKGCIHLWVSTETPSRMNCANELWTMDGDGDWTKVYSNSVPNLFFLRPDHRPLHLMENGDFLMHALERCVYQLDLKTLTEDRFLIYTSSEKMEFNEGAKYVETFVSPNQFIE